MKKLLTLALGLILSSTMLNAQLLCNFTYQGDPTSGLYYFSADPASGDSLAYSYQWTFNNGSVVSNGLYAQYQYNQTTVDNVTLTIYNNADSSLYCTSTQAVGVVVDSSGGTQCPIAYEQVSPADPYTFVFYVPGANYAPTWTFSDGTTSTGMEVTTTFQGPGIHSVCMTITGGGFTCNSCVDVFVPNDSTITSSCNADFWTSTSAFTAYCMPMDPAYSSNVTYSWDFGDGTSSTEAFPYHVYEAGGFYDVCLTVTNASCFQTTCQTIVIDEVDPVYPDSLCGSFFLINQISAYEIEVINGTSGNDLTFEWLLTNADGSITVTATGAYPTLQVESTGLFNFCLTVTNSNGCSSMYCDSMFVDTLGLLGGRLNSAGFTINVVSPQEATGFITGIENGTAATFGIYPNPFSDVVTINTGAKAFKSYAIYSVDGKQVQAGSINGTVQTLNTSDLSHGIYVLTLTDANGERQVQKLVKK
jgi:PKD repeat protein